MIGNYENHIEIVRDKFCPFKIVLDDTLNTEYSNWHTNLEVIFIKCGQAIIQYDAEELKVQKGDMIIVNSGAIHNIKPVSDLVYYCIIIGESFCKENGIPTKDIKFNKKVYAPKFESFFQDAYTLFLDYQSKPTPINTAKYRGLVLSFLVELYENYINESQTVSPRVSSKERHIKAAISFINENLSKELTLDMIADHCGITKHHLSREFKLYTGQTVLTYVNSLRCRKASSCLAEGMNVTEAAIESGFENLSYFSRTYKRFCGMPPSKAKG